MSDQTKYIWMDGELKLWAEAQIHVMSHALHYGSGFFEGIKCYSTQKGPAVFRLVDHIKRLVNSAQVYKMTIPYSVDEIVEACINLVKANEHTDCYLRPITFYGYDTLGVHPKSCPVHLAIATFIWGAYLGAEALEKGVRVTISPWRKFHSSSFPTTAKASGQYLNSLLAVQDAKEKGFHEALLLNAAGDISEGSGQNIFLVKNGEVFTNSEDSCILMGITRDSVIRLLKDMDIPINIGKLSLGQLFNADEAFFTGSASEVSPIREVDGRYIGTGLPGPLTKKIQTSYFETIKGEKPEYHHWLSFVNDIR